MAPSSTTILFRFSFFPFVFLLSILISSCTASSPRFRSKDDAEPGKSVNRHGKSVVSKEAEEESKENDKHVDVDAELPNISKTSTVNPAVDRHKVMDEVLALMGTPYVFSGTDSNGIDCSGFTSKIYRNAMNTQLPHSTSGQYALGAFVNDDARMFGDLLFFNTTGESPSHVGIYLGRDLFAHASVSSGVTISSLESSYYRKRYLGAKRVIP